MPLALMAKRGSPQEIQKAQNDYENFKAVALKNMATRIE
jgi:hypothetical protein